MSVCARACVLWLDNPSISLLGGRADYISVAAASELVNLTSISLDAMLASFRQQKKHLTDENISSVFP